METTLSTLFVAPLFDPALFLPLFLDPVLLHARFLADALLPHLFVPPVRLLRLLALLLLPHPFFGATRFVGLALRAGFGGGPRLEPGPEARKVDLIHHIVSGGSRRLIRAEQTATGGSRFVGFDDGTYQDVTLSTGFKSRPFGQSVITANVLIRLNEGGLRARIVPTLGLAYVL